MKVIFNFLSKALYVIIWLASFVMFTLCMVGYNLLIIQSTHIFWTIGFVASIVGIIAMYFHTMQKEFE